METRSIERMKRKFQANYKQKHLQRRDPDKHRLDSQSDHLVADTKIKHGDRSCDLTLLKIYLQPIGEDSKY